MQLALPALVIALAACGKPAAKRAGVERPVRIGYSTRDAIVHMAQIVEVFRRTDVLEAHGIRAELVAAPGSDEVGRLLLEGAIDVSLNTGGWTFQTLREVPGSPPRVLAEIFGGSVVVAMRKGDEVAALLEAGNRTLETPSRKRLIDLFVHHGLLPESADPSALDELVRLKRLTLRERYRYDLPQLTDELERGAIDLFFAWGHFIPELRQRRDVRLTPFEARWSGAVIAREAFVEQHPELVVELLLATKEAYVFTLSNKSLTAGWAASLLGTTPEHVHKACLDSPLYGSAVEWEEVSLIPTVRRRRTIDRSLHAILETGRVNPAGREVFDFSWMERAEELARKRGHLTPERIKVRAEPQ